VKGVGVIRSVAVVALGAGLVAGATHVPRSFDLATGAHSAAAPAPASGEVPVTSAELVCPGPETLGVPGVADAHAQTATVLSAAAPEAVLPPNARQAGDGVLATSGLPAGGTWGRTASRGAVLESPVTVPQSVLVTGSAALAAGAVATQRTLATRGADRGLTTATCGPATAEAWLVGGGAEPGRRKRVVLTNPGPNPVTVDLDVLGAGGPVGSANGHGVVVAPYARTAVLLDAVSGTEASPVVHVTTHGGDVQAVLNDSWLDGVVPRGGDDAVASAPPAPEQVVPGVGVDGPARLRVAVPGDVEGIVQTRVLTATGPRPVPADAVVRVAGHSTRDIDLGALPPDAYAVQVRADVPVVAGAVVERRGKGNGPSDLAWTTATTPVDGLAGMALASPSSTLPGAELQLVSAGHPSTVTVTTVSPAGAVTSQTVDVPADALTRTALTGAASVWVAATKGAVRAAVTTWTSDPSGVMLSVTPLSGVPLTMTPATVREARD